MSDREMLRELAKRFMEVCTSEAQTERRRLWRMHNSFRGTRPLIYVRAYAWNEMAASRRLCEDPFFRPYENHFRETIFRAAFGDDSILEPWLPVGAVRPVHPDGHWGVPVRWSDRTAPAGSRVWDSPIKDEADIAKLAVPRHAVDEAETERRAARVRDAVGDIVPLWIDRGPVWQTWAADLSTDLAKLRGLEQMMWDMTDRPDWLRRLLAFMRDGVLKAQEEAEKAGDWSLGNHNNQAMPYAEELPDPAPDGYGTPRKNLWVFCASQETTLVGPAMFEEFMLAYQRPIIEKFGLASYGCCEDLTRKIPVLRKIANLRRIAVAPVANVAACAEQIGTDYILSYRPSPADMVSYRFDPERVRTILRRDLAACRDCHTDITLKDVETVESDPDRIRRWVGIVREVIGA